MRGSFECSEAKRTIRSSAAAASQTALLIRWPRVRALSPARVRVSAYNDLHAIDANTARRVVIRTLQGATDERGLRRFAARRRGPDRARHPRAAVRERRRSFSARRRDGGRVVAENEVEVVWFGSSRRVRDLLGLEQD